MQKQIPLEYSFSCTVPTSLPPILDATRSVRVHRPGIDQPCWGHHHSARNLIRATLSRQCFLVRWGNFIPRPTKTGELRKRLYCHVLRILSTHGERRLLGRPYASQRYIPSVAAKGIQCRNAVLVNRSNGPPVLNIGVHAFKQSHRTPAMLNEATFRTIRVSAFGMLR